MRLRVSAQSRFILAAVLCGLATALSAADFAISAALPALPGVKIGLANIVTMFAVYALPLPYALMICAVRSIVAALLSGAATMLLFSLSGGIASIFVMWLLKNRLSVIKVSVTGAITHNMLQLITSWALTDTWAVAYYAPALLISGAVSGFCIGVLCAVVFERLGVKSAPKALIKLGSRK